MGKRLQKGVSDLAVVLRPVSDEYKYVQKITKNEIQWVNQDSRNEILFFYIPDPRDHASVSRIYKRTKDVKCSLSCIFVHQWMAGFGNWDVFALNSQIGLRHWNRFWGQRYLLNDTGPYLRDDIYTLFKCGQDFPLISRKKWAKMLAASKEKTMHQLAVLAAEHSCFQVESGNLMQWNNSKGETEAMFAAYQNIPHIEDYIQIYDQIKINKCPVTFIFQKHQPGVYDIFRFSARSYLEHHNQAK